MFLFVIKSYAYYSTGGKFFTHSLPRSEVKVVPYPRDSNWIRTGIETLQTYTLLVMVFIIGEINFKAKFLKVQFSGELCSNIESISTILSVAWNKTN